MNTKTEIATGVELGSTSASTNTLNEMTPIQLELVRASFAQVAQMADAAGALFYRRLFELDPSLRSLFRSDLHEQGRKLIQMLGMAVAWLDRPDMLLPTPGLQFFNLFRLSCKGGRWLRKKYRPTYGPHRPCLAGYLRTHVVTQNAS